MSGTRSPSPPAPATSARGEALLVVAHGECGGAGDNQLANALVEAMQASERYSDVGLGFIRGAPALEDVAADLDCAALRVYPLFMSDGYYVKQAIPRRLGLKDGMDARGRRVVVDEPLGLAGEFPALLLEAALAAARERAFDPCATTLLLVAHGSTKSTNSRDAARKVSQAMAQRAAFAGIELAFIEEAPFFADRLETMARPALVLGLFAGEGMHASNDVADTVHALGDPSLVLVPRLGGYRPIIELLAARLA